MGRTPPFTRVWIGLFLALAACKSAPPPAPPEPTDEIRLVRTECYGTCPSYSVVIRRDGSGSYEGRRHVKVTGTKTFVLTPSEVSRLFAAAEAARLFELEDDYSTKCPEFWTDNPSEVITVRLGSRDKTVTRDFGCRGIPELERLDELCALVDEVSGTSAWVGD